MLISLRWLNEFLTAPGEPTLDAETVSEALTSLGLEVEGVETHSALPGLIVGEVRRVETHPNADRLRVVQVFDGDAEQTVVCGAPNVPEPGGKIAFATVGTTMPAGFEIGERELRGVESRGMICSEAELLIGPDDEGIVILPAGLAPGDALADALPDIADTVIEISVTPNRPDALGHLGVARDLAAKLGRTLQRPPIVASAELDALPVESDLVHNEAPERCGRYLGYCLDGVVVGPSPLAMRVRLYRLGLRPINNVVDITNYCLMEYGQPMHAFDRARLAERRVVIRLASQGRKMQTLDEQEVSLHADDLVIADAKNPQALAGVMGGKASMVHEGSDALLLEVAHFGPAGVRRSARRHGFHTDSSHRFERGTDWGAGLTQAAARALWLLREHAGATLRGRCEVRDAKGLPRTAPIRLRPRRIEGLLGMQVPHDQAAQILRSIDVVVDDTDPQAWACTVPSHRPDLSIEEDLIEEVMRFHGLDHLPAQSIARRDASVSVDEESRATGLGWRDRLVDALAAAGLHELVSLAFTSLGSTKTGRWTTSPVIVANPLRQQDAYLRTSLLPGLLDALKLNLTRHSRAVGLFEQGRVYGWRATPTTHAQVSAEIDKELPHEQEACSFVLGASPAALNACDAVAKVLQVFASLGISVVARNATEHQGPVEQGPHPAVHPGVQALLFDTHGGALLGWVGELHPDHLRALDLPRPWTVMVADLRVGELRHAMQRRDAFTDLPRFPASSRDLSLDLADGVGAATVISALESAANELQLDQGVRLSVGDGGPLAIEFVENYRGEGISQGRRAILLRLHYRDADQTVSDEIVQALHDKIVAGALATLRERDDVVHVR